MNDVECPGLFQCNRNCVSLGFHRSQECHQISEDIISSGNKSIGLCFLTEGHECLVYGSLIRFSVLRVYVLKGNDMSDFVLFGAITVYNWGFRILWKEL